MYKSVDDFALVRRKAVEDGLESAELSALMIEKFAEGASSAGDREAITIADRHCTQIDSNYLANRKLRYERVAKLDLTAPQKKD